MADVKSCGAVVFTRESGEIRYVLVHQLHGFYGLPKGRVEGNETERETALREIYEEVGLRPDIIEGFRETSEYILPKTGQSKQVVFFLAEYENQEIHPQESELSGAVSVPYGEAIELLRHDGTKRVLTEAHKFLSAR